ncbi:MAG: NAD(P)-binding domain-containing protein [Phycisphaerales bacterium]|jgi:pyrroline-5-carboxylate reductase|nr:NAD(P)-binding domain-containing protein [Phycisphaerales bacterium]
MNDTPAPTSLVILGAGHMGSAIARGVVGVGVLPGEAITLVDPGAVQGPLSDTLANVIGEGATLLPSMPTRLAPGAALLLAVKPQVYATIAPSLATMVPAGTPVISIMAGITRARIQQDLRTEQVVRAMPNLPVAVGCGCTALVGPTLGELRGWSEQLFASVGTSIVLDDESLLDAFTALAGSGPAYLFYLGEALSRAGQQVGFGEFASREIARQVLLGAAAMLECDGRSFESLRAAVTSPGGTTHAACTTLDARGVMDAFTAAIKAGTARAGELSGT